MSLKELFNKTQTVLADKSLEDVSNEYSSAETALSFFDSKRKYIPDIDFTNPANFCKFGLAEEYYKNSFKYIYSFFPYDGSRGEELKWFNDSIYLDRYVYENIYPKTVGMLDFEVNTDSLIWTNYINSSNSPYIPIYGGLNIDKNFNSEENKNSIIKIDLEEGLTFQYFLKTSDQEYTSSISGTVLQSYCHFGVTTPSEYTSSCNEFVLDVRGDSNYENNVLNIKYYSGSNIFSQSISFLNIGAIDGYNNLTIGVSYNTSTFNFESDFYLNGLLIFSTHSYCSGVTTTQYLTGVIGCLPKVSDTYGYGAIISDIGYSPVYSIYGNYPAINIQIDDFRFWARKLTGKEIYQNYNNRIYGNYDEKSENNRLLLNYKFNEGIVGNDTEDSIILDYSGRKSNSRIYNYNSSMRLTSSAIDESGGSEFQDPILNINNQSVSSIIDKYTKIGKIYDYNNPHALLNHFSEWIVDDDYKSNQELLKLTQILSTQLDEIYLLGKNIPNLKNTNYFSSGSYNEEIISRILSNYGLETNNLFSDLSFDEWFLNKNDNITFVNSIQKIKVSLYKSLYNNLVNIYKTKGTEQSIRNVFRSLGFDENLYKIKYYSNNDIYEINGEKRSSVLERKNYLDLSGEHLFGTVYQNYSGSGSKSFISGSLGKTTSSCKELGHGLTFETTVIFGKTRNNLEDNYVYFPNSSLSGSLFGFYTPLSSNIESTDTTLDTSLPYFNVFFNRTNRERKKAKFILNMNINSVQTQVESEEYDVFDDTKWTFALRFKPKNQLFEISNYTNNPDWTYNVELYGIQENAGNILNEFTITQSFLTASSLSNPFNISYPKKPYIGSLRQNITGSILFPTQAKFSYFRSWFTYLSDLEVQDHAMNPYNYGLVKPYENISNETLGLSVNYIPRIKSLILNWDFQTLDSSDSNGQFDVLDFSSGSTQVNNYQWFENIIDRKMIGRGFGFNTSSTSMVDKNYVMSSKNRTIDNLLSSDLINISTESDRYYGKSITPVSYILSVEKNVYDVVNEEILNYFSNISNFNELIGEPINYYRDSYKQLDKLKMIFFNKLESERIDVNKYFSYYKWLDSVINYLIYDLIPISMRDNFKLGLIIESHLLERNKYAHPVSILKLKNNDKLFQITSFFHPNFSWAPSKAGQKLTLDSWNPRINPIPNKVHKL